MASAALKAWRLTYKRGLKRSPAPNRASGFLNEMILSVLDLGRLDYATGLALQVSAFVPLAIGAALFLLSDLILAAELFNGRSFPLIGDVIWLTYGPAQALIVYSVSAALIQIR